MTRTEAKNAASKWTPWVMIALSITATGATVVYSFSELRAEFRAGQANTREAIGDLKSRLERIEGLYFVPGVREGAGR